MSWLATLVAVDSSPLRAMSENDRLLDAALAGLAGLDYLDGAVIRPEEDAEVARREGWIWVRRPGPSAAS